MLSAKQAREKFSAQMAAYVLNLTAPFDEKLQFDLPSGNISIIYIKQVCPKYESCNED
ncbi:MAG: hypothetical protein M3421_08300 [Bacteroidota bacterium]|nr:hypothetical protein [Bacteroidota bacterium]